MTNSERHNIDDVPVWHACFAAAQIPAVRDALASLYNDLDAAVTRRGPTCWTSGKCCNFNAYGHRMYVTALEIAWLLPQAPPPGAIDPAGPCVYQREGLCIIHAIRPLGCRVFFCQEAAQQWQQDMYEHFQTRLRTLHDMHDVPYRYMEWRDGLAQANRIKAG